MEAAHNEYIGGILWLVLFCLFGVLFLFSSFMLVYEWLQPTTPLEPCAWLNKLSMEVWSNFMEPRISKRLSALVEVSFTCICYELSFLVWIECEASSMHSFSLYVSNRRNRKIENSWHVTFMMLEISCCFLFWSSREVVH